MGKGWPRVEWHVVLLLAAEAYVGRFLSHSQLSYLTFPGFLSRVLAKLSGKRESAIVWGQVAWGAGNLSGGEKAIWRLATYRAGHETSLVWGARNLFPISYFLSVCGDETFLAISHFLSVCGAETFLAISYFLSVCGDETFLIFSYFLSVVPPVVPFVPVVPGQLAQPGQSVGPMAQGQDNAGPGAAPNCAAVVPGVAALSPALFR